MAIHGHRKIAAASATFAGGATLGKDLLVYFWDQIAVRFLSVDSMPEVVAIEIVTLITLAVFYLTREETPEIILSRETPVEAEDA